MASSCIWELVLFTFHWLCHSPHQCPCCCCLYLWDHWFLAIGGFAGCGCCHCSWSLWYQVPQQLLEPPVLGAAPSCCGHHGFWCSPYTGRQRPKSLSLLVGTQISVLGTTIIHGAFGLGCHCNYWSLRSQVSPLLLCSHHFYESNPPTFRYMYIHVNLRRVLLCCVEDPIWGYRCTITDYNLKRQREWLMPPWWWHDSMDFTFIAHIFNSLFFT